MQVPVLRNAVDQDFGAVLALNQSNRPHVSSLSTSDLTALARQAPYFKVSLNGNRICGFLLVLSPEADYASLNFQWFKTHYDDFLYIDRIVVRPDARRTGLGYAFYQDLEFFARDLGVSKLACEYNLKPPNEISAKFHDRFGFVQVGTQDTEGGKKTVSLQIKSLS